VISGLATQAFCQSREPASGTTQDNGLPRVFMIGEYEKPYERMAKSYSGLLMHQYGGDMDRAFSGWAGFLTDMEEHADAHSFDLKGLKLWMNVFFNKDGSIQHIVYFPKPNSRNMSFEQLTAFLEQFCIRYRFKDPLTDRCSHFGSATFPTFLKRN
jgi:hypothetical protein